MFFILSNLGAKPFGLAEGHPKIGCYNVPARQRIRTSGYYRRPQTSHAENKGFEPNGTLVKAFSVIPAKNMPE